MRRTLILLAILASALTAAAPASAQDVDPCDVNPDLPECNVPPIAIAPAPTCPAGGFTLVVFGEPLEPVCFPAPPAAAPAPATPPPATVIQQTIVQQVLAAPLIPANQLPGCLSRRRFDVTIPQRFRWGTRVRVVVGGETQMDGGIGGVFVRANHRIRVDLRARPCGVYAVVVTKKGKRPWVRLYTAGPHGNMSGFNIAMARARAASNVISPWCREDDPCWTWSTMGNRTRGIVTTDGARLRVGPCRFRRLRQAHGIDWTRTPHLRGDYIAARTGCRR